MPDQEPAEVKITRDSGGVRRTQKPIEVGDIVYLNSGSPPMTVTGISQFMAVTCEWQGDDKIASHQFPAVCLRHSEPPWNYLK